ncbi:ribonuclease III family protein [Methanoculleus sp. FWC-SCC1]|uniref:Ribonuclease III family protein n=1 Tax=Methanoculleus frigidifontis TaxID=2584085 RepID=A0ABT8MDV2_9EURY|nr:ribonuclease III domain-containing protein [Methanoculleus sp. FWC-SCC1]MDN7026071.1 ribonuclease III family protein [Methanoculleus sp. FWC-SCC1]
MPMQNQDDLAALERLLDYTFRDRSLLERALTRPAYAREQGLYEDAHQEALATLGDAVVTVIVIQSIMARGISKKGEITAEKMKLVSLLPLNEVGRAMRLQEFIRFGRGEAKQEIWRYSDALTETLEAIAGAVFLDSGMAAEVERSLRAVGCVP